MRFSLRVAVGCMAAALVTPGSSGTAAPILPAQDPGGGGSLAAVFVYADAADRSQVHVLAAGTGGALVFDNRADPLGTARRFDAGPDAPAFRLDNLTQGYSLPAATIDPLPGLGFARFVSDFGAFGVGALPAAAADALAALGAPPVLYYVGFEDRQGGDFDYNDLVLAVVRSPVAAAVVAEPAGVALLASGLLGLGLGLGVTRRRRRPARAASSRPGRAHGGLRPSLDADPP